MGHKEVSDSGVAQALIMNSNTVVSYFTFKLALFRLLSDSRLGELVNPERKEHF